MYTKSDVFAGGLLLCVQDISMCDEAEQTDHGEDGQPPPHEDHSRGKLKSESAHDDDR